MSDIAQAVVDEFLKPSIPVFESIRAQKSNVAPVVNCIAARLAILSAPGCNRPPNLIAGLPLLPVIREYPLPVATPPTAEIEEESKSKEKLGGGRHLPLLARKCRLALAYTLPGKVEAVDLVRLRFCQTLSQLT